MGKPCGVDYELKCFVGETHEDKPHKRSLFQDDFIFDSLRNRAKARAQIKERKKRRNITEQHMKDFSFNMVNMHLSV